MKSSLVFSLLLVVAASANQLVSRANQDDPLSSCPGYKASKVKSNHNGFTADLTLAGKACNVYGSDLTDLTIEVVYETGRSDYFESLNTPRP